MTQVSSVYFGEDTTENIINNVTSATTIKADRTQEQFFTDVKKTISDGLYTNQDEAIKWVLDYAQSKWVKYDWIDSNSINMQMEEKADTGIWTKIADVFTWGIERIWEAWVWLAEWKFTMPEAFIRWWAWALQSFFSPLSWLIWEWIEEWIQAMSDDFKQNVMEKTTPTIQWVVQWYQWQSPEQQRRLDNIWVWLEVLLEFVWWAAIKKPLQEIWQEAISWTKRFAQQGFKWAKEWFETWLERTKSIVWDFWKRTDDNLLQKLDIETTRGKIWDIEVDIPIRKTSITEKAAWPFIEKDAKVLAGRAISPRTVWKNVKQKLWTITNVEAHTKKFYENVRLGKFEWNIDTLEDAAQTIVNNIDTIWARIWNWVAKLDDVVDFDTWILKQIDDALAAKWAEVSPATSILKKFRNDVWEWTLTTSEAFSLKKLFSNEVNKLFKAWDAWTDQYKALSDWVRFLNTKIDELAEIKLWAWFLEDKELYKNLKTLADDIVASALVEWRRAPNSLAEQIWMIESIFNPIASTKNKLIQTVWEANRRWWAWKELMKQYDNQAVKAFDDFKKASPATSALIPDDELKAIPVTTIQWVDQATNKILGWLIIAKENVEAAWRIIKEFIQKHWEDFKNKLWELFDDLADKVWARSKFIDDTWRSLDDFWDVAKSKNKILREWPQKISETWNDTWLVARERFNIPELEKLWAWSDRLVFELWDNKVVKISKTARWLEQTAQWTDYLLQDAWIVPKVFESWRNYVITERLRPFKELNISEKKILNDFIKDMDDLKPWFREFPDMWKIHERLEKYGWEDLANYDMQTFWWNDIKKRNLSIKNGRPVLIDEWTINLTNTIDQYKWLKNLDDVEFRDIHSASRAAKKRFWDIDKNTMFNIWWVLIWWDVLLESLAWNNNEI